MPASSQFGPRTPRRSTPAEWDADRWSGIATAHASGADPLPGAEELDDMGVPDAGVSSPGRTDDGDPWAVKGEAPSWETHLREPSGRGTSGRDAGHRLRDADGGGLLPFARRHLAIVVVALVVGLCLAASYLFRARTAAVPLSVVAGSPSARESFGARAAHASGVHPSAGTSGEPSGATTAEASATVAVASRPANVTVQVIGGVRRPGVVVLPGGSRVQDAIRAAGGLQPAVSTGELNLAIVLSDADQVVVGTPGHPGGEVRPGTPSGGADASQSATTRKSVAGDSASLVVDLNTATLAQLDALPGVGPTTAQRILDWRTQHGHFTSAQELQEVEGIGPKSYAKLAPHVRV